MARFLSTDGEGTRFSGIARPPEISADPELEDEIAKCKLWVLRRRLMKHHRVDARLSKSSPINASNRLLTTG